MSGLDALAKLNGGSAADAGAATQKKDEAGSAERFLKLLVAQMQNQDPLNPLDNAQVTSQVAQINTVSGIEKLNKTIEGLAGRFGQLQAMQGAALVGRGVLVEGDRLTAGEGGVQQGGFELASAAERTTVEILGRGGEVIDRVELGGRDGGRHFFDWKPRSGTDLASVKGFRVVAQGAGQAVATTPLVRDRVDAVATGGDTLTLELRASGPVGYERIKAFN